MQAIHKNGDKRDNSRRTNSVDVILCVKKVGGYLARKCLGELRSRNVGICNSGRIFGRPEERVWRRRQ